MNQDDLHAVTGAFGYSGKYIAERLLSEGKSVVTLTNSIHRKHPFGERLRAVPFHFDKPEELTDSLRATPSYAILRPTVLFGKEDILVNNIAWALRHLPMFGVFGDGQYKLQPIYVGDLAEIAVQQGQDRENRVIDAIGPETFTYRELAETVGEIIGKKRPVVSVPPTIGYAVAWVIGKLVGDVMITREEIAGLMANLLYVESPPTGKTRLTDWAKDRASTLGLLFIHKSLVLAQTLAMR